MANHPGKAGQGRQRLLQHFAECCEKKGICPHNLSQLADLASISIETVRFHKSNFVAEGLIKQPDKSWVEVTPVGIEEARANGVTV